MRTIEEIHQELMETFAKRSGLTLDPGCDLAVRFYALAAELQALEIQAEWVLDQSFPQTAQGIYLDRHAEMRGIHRTAAQQSKGRLRFLVENAPTAPLRIPAGTVCMTAEELRFQTTEVGTIQPGSLTVDVAAQSLETGEQTNVATGTVTILTACPVAVTACTNPEPFLGGCQEESDTSLRQRILESYLRLPNGANAAYYERTALQHPSVAAAKAVGRARGIGTVNVYVASESGIPERELLQVIQADLQEKREIAVDVQVLAPVSETVDLEVELEPAAGYRFQQAKQEVEQALATLFSGHLLGKGLQIAELGNRIYHCPAVANYHIKKPLQDHPADPSHLPRMGTLTLTQMGG